MFHYNKLTTVLCSEWVTHCTKLISGHISILFADITFRIDNEITHFEFKTLASNYVKKGDNLFRNQINKKIAPNSGFP